MKSRSIEISNLLARSTSAMKYIDSGSAFLASIAFAASSAGASAAQGPNLQPGLLLPGTPLVGPASGTQQDAAVSAGAAAALLVFEDSRAGDRDLFGVRVDSSGAAIDALPFSIVRAPGDQSSPQVCWNGARWLVVFENQVSSPFGYFEYETAAVRVAPTGEVLDAEPIAVALDSTGGYFGVASDGQDWVIAYTGFSAGNSGIFARRIASDGTVLDPAGVPIQPATYFIYFGLAVTYAEGEYVFSWQANGLTLRRTTTALQPIDAAPVALPVSSASVAGGGAQLLVSWVQQTPQFTMKVVGRRYDLALQPLGPAPFDISSTVPAVASSVPDSVWDGAQWIVSWLVTGTQDVRAARVSASGAVLDPAGKGIPDGSPNYLYNPALGALPGGGALIVWDDLRYSSTLDVFGNTLSGQGVVGAERLYSTGSEAQGSPRVAAGPEQSLIAYRAELGDGTRVLAQRMDRLGQPLDLEPIEVASAAHLNLFAGGVAWNGAVYLVTWSDASQGVIFGRRLLPDGQWLDAVPIALLAGWGADAATLGQDFLVTGLRSPGYPEFVNSYGARVRGSDGLVLDPTPMLLSGSYATRARIATLGGRWLVATERHWSHDENPADVMLHFVSAAGTVTPAGSAGLFNIQDWGIVDIASSPTSAVVVMQTGSNWTNTDVYARRILPDGSMPAAAVNVTSAAGMGQSRPSVVWTGAEYVVAYQSYQNNVWFYDFEPDVYAVRLAESGAQLDAQGFALWNGEDHEVSAEAASLGDGRALFACSQFAEFPYQAMHVGARALRPDGLANFGSGTAGCFGAQHMDASGEPYTGNQTFALSCDGAPAGGPGLLALSSGADPAGSDPYTLGILVHVATLPPNVLATVGWVTDVSGLATTLLPIPGDASLQGLSVHAQAFFPWSGPCQPSPYGLSSSDGITLTIQAP